MDIRKWFCKNKQNSLETQANASGPSNSNDVANTEIEPAEAELTPPAEAEDVTLAGSTEER